MSAPQTESLPDEAGDVKLIVVEFELVGSAEADERRSSRSIPSSDFLAIKSSDRVVVPVQSMSIPIIVAASPPNAAHQLGAEAAS